MSHVAIRIAAVLALIAGPAGEVMACSESSSVYLGTVCLTAGTYCPPGYAPADGAPTSNPMLPSVLGRSNLPDLRGKAPAGTQYCIAVTGVYPTRN